MFSSLFRPLGRGTFSCAAKRKYPKRKPPDGLPATRVPCASRTFGRSPNSQTGNTPGQLKQGGSLSHKSPAMLGCANGMWGKGGWPRRCSRAPQEKPGQARPLFEPEASVARSASWARAGFSEERREPRGTCAVGPAAGSAFLLVRFLWRSKENELALQGETEIRSSDKEYVGRTPVIQYRARESTSPEGAKQAGETNRITTKKDKITESRSSWHSGTP